MHEAAGHRVASMFSVASEVGPAATYTTNGLLSLFDRSWPGVSRFVLGEDDASLARLVTSANKRDLLQPKTTGRLVLLHLAPRPDRRRARAGFSSQAYRRAVARTDRRLGTIVHTVARHPRLRRHVALVIAGDHGG